MIYRVDTSSKAWKSFVTKAKSNELIELADIGHCLEEVPESEAKNVRGLIASEASEVA